jgi:hypothetical protein
MFAGDSDAQLRRVNELTRATALRLEETPVDSEAFAPPSPMQMLAAECLVRHRGVGTAEEERAWNRHLLHRRRWLANKVDYWPEGERDELVEDPHDALKLHKSRDSDRRRRLKAAYPAVLSAWITRLDGVAAGLRAAAAEAVADEAATGDGARPS